MNSRLKDGGTVILLSCAVALTARAWFARPSSPSGSPITVQASLATEARSGGHPIGGSASPDIWVVEFADFQCPFCERQGAVLDSLVGHYAGAVGVRYRHFPLEQVHPSAMGAAIASECAARHVPFRAIYDELYRARSEIGTAPWSSFAGRAGVVDQTSFEGCIVSEGARDRVDEDLALGSRIGISATPFLLVGDRGFVGLQTFDALREIVDEELGR